MTENIARGTAIDATKQIGAKMKLTRTALITRDEIRSIPVIHKSIQRDKEQLRFLREKATSVPSGISDGERVQTSPSNDGMKFIEDAVDLDRDIRQKELELIELQTKAGRYIRTIEHELTRRVMICRYIKCYSWTEIAAAVGYDLRYIHRLESSALDNLAMLGHADGMI